MDPFEEIRYLGWNLEGVDNFEYSPSHSTFSERLKKTLYLAEGFTDENGISLPVADTAVEVFHAVSGSPLRRISPRHVANLSKRSRVAPCTLLLAMIYARRLKTTNETYVQNMTSADLLLVSMIVASKFLYDEGEDEEMFSDEWAKAANVDLKHVYELEREFLSAMDWKLYVHSEEFFHFIRQIETRIALSQGLSRGWFSYSDMEVLMTHPIWRESWGLVFYQTLKVLGVCLAIYALCASSIIWSSMLLHHPRLQSPSACSCLPFTLDSHIQKSTLVHRNIEVVNTFPLASETCQCQSKDVNESLDIAGIELDDTDRVGQNSTIRDLTSTLHEKYHKAQQALFIFYHALLTAVSDVSLSSSFQAEYNDDSFALESNSCVCTCNPKVGSRGNTLNTSDYQRSSVEQSTDTDACQCPCEHLNVDGHWWNQSNKTQTNVTDRTGLGQLDISTWSHEPRIDRGELCVWSAPSLKNRFLDLEMRFATRFILLH